jgi:hypothetical protein
MMETIIAIGIVVLAAAGVGYGLYRGATGKSGCPGCRGCEQGQETCRTSQTRED